MNSKKPVYVTQPYMPPLQEFIPYLEQIWDTKWLTNNGYYHRQLEEELCKYLEVPYVSLFSNGTLALMVALQALHITGDVITTPYSFVATTHTLLWNNIHPVFVDITPLTFNINPQKIEEAITSRTTAIVPVHVYGNPCDVDEIQRIADTYNLKVIYDAAHAFGVRCNGKSVLDYGDLSVLSFHATKVFNTFEGGAIVCHDEEMKRHIDLLKNFGIADEVTVLTSGINAKMCELQAAFGLLQLKYMGHILSRCAEIDCHYREELNGVPGIRVTHRLAEGHQNYSYFPILIEPDYPLSRDALYQKLRDQGIYARRYFHPLISDFPMYRGLPSAATTNLPVAKLVSERVLCLPIYTDLAKDDQNRIIGIIKSGL